MCSSEDFFTWNDLDLDELLGEYTDDDFYSPEGFTSTAKVKVSSITITMLWYNYGSVMLQTGFSLAT